MATGSVRPIGGNHDIKPQRPAVQTLPSAEPKAVPRRPKRAGRWPLMTAVVLFLAVAVGIVYYQQGVHGLITAGRYQAVTLESGQVYFGKLTNVNDQYMKMTDVYYFQDKDGSPVKGVPKDGSAPLVKHGTELQNPEDMIVLSKRDIVSWENLKDSGKVVDAIQNYKAQQGQ